MLASILESNYKFKNIPSLFTFTCNLIFNILFGFLEEKRYKKKFDIVFDEMLENGKLDKAIKEALDENSNSFLTLTPGNVYSTTFVFSCLKKNYPLLLEMYNNYIKLDQCKDEYVTKKDKASLYIYFEHFAYKTKGRIYLIRCSALFKRT